MVCCLVYTRVFLRDVREFPFDAVTTLCSAASQPQHHTLLHQFSSIGDTGHVTLCDKWERYWSVVELSRQGHTNSRTRRAGHTDQRSGRTPSIRLILSRPHHARSSSGGIPLDCRCVPRGRAPPHSGANQRQRERRRGRSVHTRTLIWIMHSLSSSIEASTMLDVVAPTDAGRAADAAAAAVTSVQHAEANSAIASRHQSTSMHIDHSYATFSSLSGAVTVVVGDEDPIVGAIYKMRIRELRKFLSARGVTCDDCSDRIKYRTYTDIATRRMCEACAFGRAS
jgi:hypothetical protein